MFTQEDYEEFGKTVSMEDLYGPIVKVEACPVCGKVHPGISWKECAEIAREEADQEWETIMDLRQC